MPSSRGSIPREHTGDAVIDRIQSHLIRLHRFLGGIPFLDGVLWEGEVQSITTRVVHRLGREPKGFLVLNSELASILQRDATVATDPEVAINLIASVATTFRIWFIL